jgi:hypothetical protein
MSSTKSIYSKSFQNYINVEAINIYAIERSVFTYFGTRIRLFLPETVLKKKFQHQNRIQHQKCC